MPDDQRKYFRINARQASCRLSFDDRTYDTVLIDESIEGIRIGGVSLDESIQFSTEDTLSIVVDGKTILARPRNICRSDDGTFTVGLQRENACKRSSIKHQFVRHFVSLAGCNIACAIHENMSPQQSRIQIADGKDFYVEKSRIAEITIVERRLELDDPKQLRKVLVFYNALMPNINLDTSDDVIAIEYGCVLRQRTIPRRKISSGRSNFLAL